MIEHDYLSDEWRDATISMDNFIERLRSGKPIPCVTLRREWTPDGPMTYRVKNEAIAGPNGFEFNPEGTYRGKRTLKILTIATLGMTAMVVLGQTVMAVVWILNRINGG